MDPETSSSHQRLTSGKGTWSARCGESRTAGAGGGSRETTGGNTGIAPAAHSSCWAAAGPPLNYGRQAATTAERWRQVHDLTDRGTGLLECSRRLGLSLNTVKRYTAPPSQSG